MIEFEITKHIATLNEAGPGITLELNLVRWGGRPEKWDLRKWNTTPEGVRLPMKGISLSPIEVDMLRRVFEGMKEVNNDVHENSL